MLPKTLAFLAVMVIGVGLLVLIVGSVLASFGVVSSNVPFAGGLATFLGIAMLFQAVLSDSPSRPRSVSDP